MLRHIGRLRHASLTVPLSFSVLDDYRDTEKSRSCKVDSFSDVVELEEFDICNTVDSRVSTILAKVHTQLVAYPLDRLETRSRMTLASRTLPTVVSKNWKSSRSPTRADSCETKTDLISCSSSVIL